MTTSQCLGVDRRRIAVCAGTMLLVLCAAAKMVAEEEQSSASVVERNELRVAFAAASLRLAAAELAEAEDLNRRVENAVAAFEVERLKKCVALAQNNYSYAQQGVDYSQSIAEYVQARAELAELDLKMAEEIRAKHPDHISDAELEKLRCYAEVCRLRVALSDEPVSTMSIVDHLHWETHRLGEEVLQLNRRLERLEKNTTLR